MSSKRFDFNGKKVLITGGSRGIGLGISIKLHEYGAHIIALSEIPDDLSKLQQDLNYERIDIINLDLQKANPATFEELIGPHLPIHYLVNNAGTIVLEEFADIKPDSFDLQFGVNCRAAVFLSQFVAKSMISHNIKGSIVNISSQSSYTPLRAHMAYSVSKAALDAFTRIAAWELGPKGIRVNSICPTVVMTDLARRVWSEPTKAASMLAKIPLGKFAEVSDVVSAVLFLLSDESQLITGVNLSVDGGVAIS